MTPASASDLELLSAPEAPAAAVPPAAETIPDSALPADPAPPSGAPPETPAVAGPAVAAEPPAAAASSGAASGPGSAPADAASAIAVPDPLAPFSSALADDAALQQALARHPELQPAIESALRQSAEFQSWRSLFPSLQAARYAADQSETLSGFDRLFYSDQPEAARELLFRLYHNQFLRDPESGELMRDAAGDPVSTGAYDRLASAWRDSLFSALDHHAAESADRELSSALQTLRSRLASLAGNPSAAPPASARAALDPSAAPASSSPVSGNSPLSPIPPGESGAAPSLPPDVRARLERLEALEHRLESSGREQWRAWHEGLAGDVAQSVRAEIEQTLAPAALPAYLKSKVVDDVLDGINQRAAADGAYQHRIQTLLRAAQAQSAAGAAAPPDTRARILAAARAQARAHLAPVAQQVLRHALAGLREAQQQRLAKVAGQRAKVEVKSAGGDPNPARHTDVERIRGAERALGRRLSDREILDL